MVKSAYRKVAFISSFLPQKCGIATFTSDLIKNIKAAGGKNFEPLVVAMQSESNCNYTNPVKFEVRYNIKRDYVCAADYLNFSHVDLVSVQHEFGLFGGDSGSYINLLLRKVNAPVVTTLHTVLEEPDPGYYQSTTDICSLSHKVIVMNNLAWILCEEQGNFQQALELAQRGLAITPNYVDLIDTCGVAYYRLGQCDKAAQCFTKCLNLVPGRASADAATCFHLGRALVCMGQKEEAAKNLNRALESNAETGGLSPEDEREAKSLLEELSRGN